MLTRKQLTELEYGDILYHSLYKNSDGSPQRWRVNGKVITRKTKPNKVTVPLKFGLYAYDKIHRIHEFNVGVLWLRERDAVRAGVVYEALVNNGYMSRLVNIKIVDPWGKSLLTVVYKVIGGTPTGDLIAAPVCDFSDSKVEVPLYVVQRYEIDSNRHTERATHALPIGTSR